MIELLEEYGREDLAKVYVAALRDSKEYLIEFVESIQPPTPREKKWVLIVSTLLDAQLDVKCVMLEAIIKVN